MNERKKFPFAFLIVAFFFFLPITNYLPIRQAGQLPIAHAATISSSEIGPSSLYSGLVGWWTFDGKDMFAGTALDKSGNGNTGTLTNISTSTFYVQGKMGQGFRFDGVDDYVDAGTASSLNLTGSMTISAWIKTPVIATEQLIVSKLSSAAAMNYYLEIDTSKVGFAVTGNAEKHSNTVLKSNTWYHVVATYNLSNVNFYINGVADGSPALTDVPASSAFSLKIGRFTNSLPIAFNGTLDDVRIYNRALSASEVSKLYNLGSASHVNTAEVGPANLNSGLVGWWTFDGKDMSAGKALDRSGNGNTGTLVNISTSTFYTQGKIGQAFNFDGVDDYVGIATTSSDFERTDPFSFAVWAKWDSRTGNCRTFIGRSDNSGNRGTFFLQSNPSGCGSNANAIQFDLESSVGHVLLTQTAAQTVSPNKWYHVVVTYDGSQVVSGVKIYINGVSSTVSQFGSNTLNASIKPPTASWRIGDDYTNDWFNGSMDDLRIYSRALSATEVSQLYNLGTASHINTTEVGPAGLNSGLVGWWTFDGKDMSAGKALDKSGNGNTGALTNISTSTFYVQGKIGQAFKFDGVDDSVDFGSPSALNLSGAMTISAWIKPSSVAVGAATIFGSYDGSQNIEYAFEFNRTAGRLGFIQGNGSFNLTRKNNTNLVANRWYHVAIVRTGSSGSWTLTFYLNGVSDGAPTETLNPGTLQTVSIGSLGDVSEYFPGTIDNVRVYSRALSATEIAKLYNLGR